MVPNWIVLGEGAFRSFRLSLLSCFLGESNVTCSTFVANVLLLWVSCSEVKPAAMSDRKRMSIGAVTTPILGSRSSATTEREVRGQVAPWLGLESKGLLSGWYSGEHGQACQKLHESHFLKWTELEMSLHHLQKMTSHDSTIFNCWMVDRTCSTKKKFKYIWSIWLCNSKMFPPVISNICSGSSYRNGDDVSLEASRVV